MENEEQLQNTTSLPCPSCGNQLAYSAEKQKINCAYCNYSEEIDHSRDKVVERTLSDALDSLSYYEPEQLDKQVFSCQNCSAQIMVEADKPKIKCGFCGSSNVNVEAFESKFAQPNGIIPFKISRSKAESQFGRWIKKGWFHPSKLKKLVPLEDLHGVYLPFWTYDANVKAEWTGEAGQHYYENVKVMVDGKSKIKRKQKTRWHSRTGNVEHFFDDILVVASKSLAQESIERILPFRMNEVLNFDPRLLVGWEAEVYQMELDQGYHVAGRIIDGKVRDICSEHLGGDTQRNLQVQSTKFDPSFKHVILPMWISSYIYQNKVYHFTINGQTGKIYGKKPTSIIKIVLLVLLVVSIALIIYFIVSRNS